MKIAIIGGGLSGTLTAIQLLSNASRDTTVYLIEQDRYKMSRGTAYSSQLAFQPLNVPAAAMGIFPEAPDDFFQWLTTHQHRYRNQLTIPVHPKDFMPRCVFGDYLNVRLQEAEAGAAKGVKLVRLHGEAMAVKARGSRFVVEISNYDPIPVDKVVLALGNFLPSQLPIPNMGFYSSSRYIASPWSAKGLYELPADASVLLIGSSLTMVDLVGSLQARGHTGKIYVVSRHGLLPRHHDAGTPRYPRLSLPSGTSLSVLQLVRFIRSKVKEAEAAGYNWRSVLDALRDEAAAIWQAFSLQEKKHFLRFVRPYWEVHRHRMPASSAAMLQELQAKGQLEVIAASLVDMEDTGEAAVVTIRKRKQAENERLQVDRVINCTGPQGDFAKIRTPLVEQLLADGMIIPDQLRLGVETLPNGMLLNAKGRPVDGLFTLGPPRRGMLYESTALREIRQQAQALAHELLQEQGLLRLKTIPLT